MTNSARTLSRSHNAPLRTRFVRSLRKYWPYYVLLLPALDVCLALYEEGERFEDIGVEAYRRFAPSTDHL